MTPLPITVADLGLYRVSREFQALGLKSCFLFDMDGLRVLLPFYKPFISPFLSQNSGSIKTLKTFCLFSPLINFMSSNFIFICNLLFFFYHISLLFPWSLLSFYFPTINYLVIIEEILHLRKSKAFLIHITWKNHVIAMSSESIEPYRSVSTPNHF